MDYDSIRNFFESGNGRPLKQDPVYKFVMRLRDKEDFLNNLQMSSGKFINYDFKKKRIVPSKSMDAEEHFRHVEEAEREVEGMRERLGQIAGIFDKLDMVEPIFERIDAEYKRLHARQTKQYANLVASRNVMSFKLKGSLDPAKIDDVPEVKRWVDAYNETSDKINALPDTKPFMEEIVRLCQ